MAAKEKAKTRKSIREAVARYNKAKTVLIGVRLVKSKDADILERLEGEPSKSGYIKKLIREDIKKGRGSD